MWSGNSVMRKTFLKQQKHVHNIMYSLENQEALTMEYCDFIVFFFALFHY